MTCRRRLLPTDRVAKRTLPPLEERETLPVTASSGRVISSLVVEISRLSKRPSGTCTVIFLSSLLALTPM